MKKLALLALFASSLFIACDNEIDINAPFTETTVVYGTLNLNETQHYIRVTRAYLGEDGILGGNSTGDSLYYDDITVELKEFNENGGQTAGYTAVEDNSVVLDSGFFTGDGYHVYRVDATLNEDRDYRVVITRSNGNIVRAQTTLVKEFLITEPRTSNFNVGGPYGTDITWNQAENGRVYRATVDMHYVEFPRNNKADSTRHVYTYYLPYETGDNLNGDGYITKSVNSFQFFGGLAAVIDPPTGNVIRIARRVELKVTAGGDDLATHINVSQPQTGILQDPPFFTNVENGAGIFSSINTQAKDDMKLSTFSLDSLVFSQQTCGLKFGKVTTTDTLFCQ